MKTNKSLPDTKPWKRDAGHFLSAFALTFFVGGIVFAFVVRSSWNANEARSVSAEVERVPEASASPANEGIPLSPNDADQPQVEKPVVAEAQSSSRFEEPLSPGVAETATNREQNASPSGIQITPGDVPSNVRTFEPNNQRLVAAIPDVYAVDPFVRSLAARQIAGATQPDGVVGASEQGPPPAVGVGGQLTPLQRRLLYPNPFFSYENQLYRTWYGAGAVNVAQLERSE